MKQEKLNNYSVRITQANKTQLIVITYEIIEDSIASAKEAYEEEDFVIYKKELKRTQKLINELTGSLDFRYGLSRELLELYRFCGKCIIDAMYRNEKERLDTVQSIVSHLKTAFAEIAESDTSGSVMKNTQTVYAGLTYGKHSLNEVFIDGNEARRGFKA